MQNKQVYQELIKQKDQKIQNLQIEIGILNDKIQLIQNQAHKQIQTAYNNQVNQKEYKMVQLENENTKLKDEVKQLKFDLNKLRQELNLSQQNNKQSNQETNQIINNGFNQTNYVSIQQTSSI